jgi:hypothetical protein
MQIPGNFPLLLKYRLPFPVIKPFVEAGHAPRVIYAPADYSSNAIPASQGFVIGGRHTGRYRTSASLTAGPLYALE